MVVEAPVKHSVVVSGGLPDSISFTDIQALEDGLSNPGSFRQSLSALRSLRDGPNNISSSADYALRKNLRVIAQHLDGVEGGLAADALMEYVLRDENPQNSVAAIFLRQGALNRRTEALCMERLTALEQRGVRFPGFMALKRLEDALGVRSETDGQLGCFDGMLSYVPGWRLHSQVRVQRSARKPKADFLEELGLDAEGTLKAWEDTSPTIVPRLNWLVRRFLDPVTIAYSRDDIPPYTFRHDIESLVSLENKRPGSAARLQKFLGIKCFGNYMVDTLVGWADSIPSEGGVRSAGVWGLQVRTLDDWTSGIGGDLDYREKPLIKDAGLWVVEVSSPEEAVSRAERLRSHFGQGSYLILAGHGTVNSVQGILTKKILNTPLVRRLDTCFTQDAPVLFSSCSTGAEGGLAEAYCDTYHRRTVGTARPSNTREYTLSWDDRRPVVDVEYMDQGVRREYIPK